MTTTSVVLDHLGRHVHWRSGQRVVHAQTTVNSTCWNNSRRGCTAEPRAMHSASILSDDFGRTEVNELENAHVVQEDV